MSIDNSVIGNHLVKKISKQRPSLDERKKMVGNKKLYQLSDQCRMQFYGDFNIFGEMIMSTFKLKMKNRS